MSFIETASAWDGEPGQEELEAKGFLTLETRHRIEVLDLTQREAAKRLKVAQADISKNVNCKVVGLFVATVVAAARKTRRRRRYSRPSEIHGWSRQPPYSNDESASSRVGWLWFSNAAVADVLARPRGRNLNALGSYHPQHPAGMGRVERQRHHPAVHRVRHCENFVFTDGVIRCEHQLIAIRPAEALVLDKDGVPVVIRSAIFEQIATRKIVRTILLRGDFKRAPISTPIKKYDRRRTGMPLV